MADRIVLDGELSLNNLLDGEVGLMSLIEVGISEIRFNSDYTITFVMTDGRTFTSEPVRGADGAQGEKGDKGDKGDAGDDYVLTQADKQEIAGMVSIPLATTTSNGLMSATDKARLDDIYTDYSSALTALGVI